MSLSVRDIMRVWLLMCEDAPGLAEEAATKADPLSETLNLQGGRVCRVDLCC